MDTQIKNNFQNQFKNNIKGFEKFIEENKNKTIEREEERIDNQGKEQKLLYEKIEENVRKTEILLENLKNQFEYFKDIENYETMETSLKEFINQNKEILDKKDFNKKTLWNSVKKSEEDYINLMINCHKEFEELVNNTKMQFWKLREKSNTYLKQVENELLDKRETILKKNKDQIDELFNQHEKAETNFVKLKDTEEMKNYNELKKLKQEKNREFFDMKIFLENEIQNHEKCLEDMKAIYQLNAEKLNYNYTVLLDKKDENLALTMELKKKERFFLDLQKKKNDEFTAKDLEYRKNNKKLTEQSKKITKQYKDLHKKFKYFEKADIKRYQEIREMSLDEIKELKKSIINCNRILMEQQLGVEITQKEILEENINPIQKKNSQEINSLKGSKKKIKFNKDSLYMKDSHISEIGEKEEDIFKPKFRLKPEEKQNLIDLVLENTDFLFDDKIKDEIYKNNNEEEKMILKLNVLRKVFSLKGTKHVNDFLIKLHLMCFNFENNNYNPELLIKSLSKILVEKTSTLKKLDTLVSKSKLMNSVVNEKLNEKTFWEQIGNVLDQRTLEVWDGLDKFSGKYYKLLLERKKSIEDTRNLKTQNNELVNLLNTYMKQDQKLIYSPEI